MAYELMQVAITTLAAFGAIFIAAVAFVGFIRLHHELSGIRFRRSHSPPRWPEC